MIVYLATNKVNGKKYVGITKNTLEQRKIQHMHTANTQKGSKFQKALRKYGVDGFTWEVIDTAITYEELLWKEMFYIKKYNSYENGYNSTSGGEGTIGIVGEDRHNAVLTEKQVIEILLSDKTVMELARQYNVNSGVISDIRNLKTWRHVTSKYFLYPLTNEDIINIYLSRLSLEELADEFNCSIEVITRIKQDKLYTEVTKHFKFAGTYS